MMDLLLGRDFEVLLETSGAIDTRLVPIRVKKIVDLKTPGSREPHTDFRELERLGPGDELKVVICDEADFRWAVRIIDELRLWKRVPVLFSPSFGQVAPQDLARWLLESRRPARLQLQLHKLIWGAEARGV